MVCVADATAMLANQGVDETPDISYFVGPTIVGTDSGETLTGTINQDVIHGFGGNDIIRGKGGNDILYGGAANDRLRGGADDDILYGNTGRDILIGQRGNDEIYGGGDNDRLRGRSGQDILCGGNGIDRVWGDSGPDTFQIDVGDGKDIIKDFGRGDDRIELLTGTDTVDLTTFGSHVKVEHEGDLMAVIQNVSTAELEQNGAFIDLVKKRLLEKKP